MINRRITSLPYGSSHPSARRQSSSVPRPRTVLLAALLAVTGPVTGAILTAPTPALAQAQQNLPLHTLETIRSSGAFHDSGTTIYVTPQHDGRYTISGSIALHRLGGELRVQSDGSLAGPITLTTTRRNSRDVVTRDGVVRRSGASLSLLLKAQGAPSEADPFRGPGFQVQPTLVPPMSFTGAEETYRDFVGSWRSESDEYEFVSDGQYLAARERRRIDGVPEIVRELVFGRTSFSTAWDQRLVGAWGDPRAGGQGDGASVELSPDKSEMYLRWRSGTTEHRKVLTRRAPAPSAPSERPAPANPTPPSDAPPRPIPPGPTQPSPQDSQNGDFAPLGAWSVRVDRVENPREDRLVHVYLTLRNDSTRQLMQTENISVLHEDSMGITVESGQGLKAQPGYPELFGSPPPVVAPGQEIRTKFVFDRNRGASTVRITVQEGPDHSADFEF